MIFNFPADAHLVQSCIQQCAPPLYYKFTSDERREVMENVENRSKRSVTTRNWMMYLFIFLLLLPLRMHTASLVRRFQERAAENEQIIIMVQHPASLYALMPRRKEFLYAERREKSMHSQHRSGAHGREKLTCARKGGRARDR
jgi:hypothetical protein